MKVKVIESVVNLPMGSQSVGETIERRINEWLSNNPTAQIRQVITSPLTVGSYESALGDVAGTLGSLVYIFYD